MIRVVVLGFERLGYASLFSKVEGSIRANSRSVGFLQLPRSLYDAQSRTLRCRQGRDLIAQISHLEQLFPIFHVALLRIMRRQHRQIH